MTHNRVPPAKTRTRTNKPRGSEMPKKRWYGNQEDDWTGEDQELVHYLGDYIASWVVDAATPHTSSAWRSANCNAL
jgi:hypothetical protein